MLCSLGLYDRFFESMSDDPGHEPLMSAMQVDINVEVQGGKTQKAFCYLFLIVMIYISVSWLSLAFLFLGSFAKVQILSVFHDAI